MSQTFPDEETGQETITRDEVKEPRRYKVLLHNDDYTTMEFVVMVLRKVFNKTEPEAVQIMYNVHNTGVGICGVYTSELAETKVMIVRQMARKDGFPLKCTMEEI